VADEAGPVRKPRLTISKQGPQPMTDILSLFCFIYRVEIEDIISSSFSEDTLDVVSNQAIFKP
jgi:hypothetical protein